MSVIHATGRKFLTGRVFSKAGGVFDTKRWATIEGCRTNPCILSWPSIPDFGHSKIRSCTNQIPRELRTDYVIAVEPLKILLAQPPNKSNSSTERVTIVLPHVNYSAAANYSYATFETVWRSFTALSILSSEVYMIPYIGRQCYAIPSIFIASTVSVSKISDEILFFFFFFFAFSASRDAVRFYYFQFLFGKCFHCNYVKLTEILHSN